MKNLNNVIISNRVDHIEEVLYRVDNGICNVSSFEHDMMENVKRQMTDLYDKQCDMYNVGCMLPYMDYTPRTLNEIMTN